MKFLNKNVKIALTVLVGLVLLYWGVNYLKGVNLFTPANRYYTEVESTEGLLVAAPITVNGFQVGQVREINYDYKKNKITVMLAMNKEMTVPEGSTISMVSGLMGGASLVLNLGDGLTGNPALAAALGRLDGITRQLQASAQQLNVLMSGLNRSVPGVMNHVNGITGNLTGATSNLNDLSVSLKQMPLDSTINTLNATLANLQALSEQLNDKNSSLGKIISDKELYDNANHAIASLDSLLTDIKAHPKRYINVKVF